MGNTLKKHAKVVLFHTMSKLSYAIFKLKELFISLLVDEKAGQVSQYCLSFPTILRQILEHISTKELIQLSLVNKQWNFEARSVIKKRGNLRAYFSGGGYAEDCSCQELEAFASDLEKMLVVPFSGLHLPINHRYGYTRISYGPLHLSYKVILDRLNWKQFSVTFEPDSEHCMDCPSLMLAKQILEGCGGVLEDLRIGFGHGRSLRHIIRDLTLPHLKILEFRVWEDIPADASLRRTCIKTLVSSAPNLKELHVNALVDLRVNILEGSSAVLVPKSTFRPLHQPICEALIGSIRSEEMVITTLHTARENPELLRGLIPKLLKASSTTLRTLIMDYLFAVPLMCYGICLENVTTLRIHMNSYRLDEIEPWILALPKGLDFTRVFPKLNQVTIYNYDDYVLDFSSDVIDAFVEQGTAMLSRALPDRATNIKLLKIHRCRHMAKLTLPLLAQMFPDVRTVHTKNEHEKGLFQDLREHFLCLEEVTESENAF